jgi:hypothetical protein
MLTDLIQQLQDVHTYHPGDDGRLMVAAGLTHHFSLGFLGFSWKIQEIHMIVRK